MKKILSLIMASAMILVLLAGCSGNSESAPAGNNVTVTVNDESGKPVAGVKVQACDDSVCMAVDTDSNGVAGFSISKNTVDVHILKVPAGFAADETVYKTDDSGKLTVTLKAAQ